MCFQMLIIIFYKKMFDVCVISHWQVFPLIFILMSKRTKKVYKSVFKFINAKIFNLNGAKTFYTDFETATRNALNEKFPHAKIKLCHFHFAQAVRRKATKINGFIDFLRENTAAKRIYYQLMYLPLLPAKCILSIFEEISTKANVISQVKFEEFLKYYAKQWIRREGPRKISVFGSEMRTTSAAEGYNRALSDYCHKKGSFFWFCVSIRNQEYMKQKEFTAYAESGGLLGHHQKKEDKVCVHPLQSLFSLFNVHSF